ncbi:methyl-accepting chemotaxis protein [Saliterribacillus persicus]|uniref:Methyl-accepting chemotaxis protein n=1 Tax=Saliterribacillus persicus TaxID=930114 RepID=A0A368XVL1_9BACI|nr:methyl-accepting chemotaxis protein [Saliterribacillus persicus]RCW72003.1 methyl-accepting chemotaxis protein [Saliterribacillus persicus]
MKRKFFKRKNSSTPKEPRKAWKETFSKISIPKWKKTNKDNTNKSNQKMVARKNSVSTKILTSLITTVLVCVIIVGLSSYYISNNIIKSKVTDASEQTIIQAGDKLDFMMNRYKDRVTEILMDQDFSNTLTSLDTYEDTNNFDYFSQKNNIDETLMQVTLIDQNVDLYLINSDRGRLISSTQTISEDTFIETEWYNQALENDDATTWIGGFQQGLSGANSDPTISFSQRLRIGGSQYLLIVELNTVVFEEALADVRFGENNQVSMVDAERRTIFSFDPTEMEETYQYDISTDPETNMTEDGDRLVFQDKSEITDWYLVGSVSAKELTKDTNVIFIVIAAIIVLSLLISLFIGRRIINMIGKPLEEMSMLMSKAKEGDLRVRSYDTDRKDEIGELAGSFNLMLENISDLMQTTRTSSTKVLDAAIELTEISQMQSQSAKEVAAASEEIASGATGLTDEAERGNLLASSIHDEVENVFQNNSEMENYAGQVLKRSNTGLDKMNELVQKTKDGASMTDALMSKVDTLKESTEQINDVMIMLTNIAQQTNLLALNAAIEAARAGDAGSGFAVVAEEIRKLSNQSKDSIDRVEEITNGIVFEVNETLHVLEEAGPRFKEQVGQAEETQEILNDVGGRMSAFTDKITEVTSSIKQLRASQETLSSTIHQVSATAEESSAISEEVSATTEEQLKVSESLVNTSDQLKELSTDLQDTLNKFKV